MKILEQEEKYLVEVKDKKELWDKEFLIYQWYLSASYEENTKIKVIFDFLTMKVKLVQVKKKRVNDNLFEKEIKYLNKNEMNFSKLIGCSFVAKRRSIKNNIFLDKFIRSNGLCDYLLEIEDQSEKPDHNIILLKNVTNDSNYYNQNLCIPFDENELKTFLTFMECFEFPNL